MQLAAHSWIHSPRSNLFDSHPPECLLSDAETSSAHLYRHVDRIQGPSRTYWVIDSGDLWYLYISFLGIALFGSVIAANFILRILFSFHLDLYSFLLSGTVDDDVRHVDPHLQPQQAIVHDATVNDEEYRSLSLAPIPTPDFGIVPCSVEGPITMCPFPDFIFDSPVFFPPELWLRFALYLTHTDLLSLRRVTRSFFPPLHTPYASWPGPAIPSIPL
ncbi:hypothetical protein BDZ89DRAFT_1149874 [Hymenopellis radicata]|nr:hypothetical protein BDZ89DRAFT_1149874 [Hymenopellis radicata]